MPQFRLTAKMAKKLKIDHLSPPKQLTDTFYDDWAVDLVRIMRKEVAICMHVETRVAVALCLADIGGAQYLFKHFPALLEREVNQWDIEGCDNFGSQIRGYFEPNLNDLFFCKTANRSVTTHMSQFKAIVERKVYETGAITQSVFDEAMDWWQLNLITMPNNSLLNYTRPIEQWESLLVDQDMVELQTDQLPSNVIPFSKRHHHDQ